MCIKMVFMLALLSFLQTSEAYIDKETFRSLIPFRECLSQKFPGLCLKETALDALNSTIMSDKPLVVMDLVEIGRNPNYRYNLSEDDLPNEVTARSSKLSDLLYAKIEEFFKSRVIKFNMAPAFDEGRGKKDKKGGMMMLAMGGMAAMMAQLFMGKIAFLAGTALVVAKLALFISAIVGLKKLLSGGGGGGETSHVVYASDGHSHGGGGWHRSLANDAQNLAYKAHITETQSGY